MRRLRGNLDSGGMMGSRFKVLVATLSVALATGAAPESASAAQSASTPIVYRGTGTLRAGSVAFKSAALWNVNRWSRGRYAFAGRVAQVSAATPRWNIYRGRTTAGFVTLAALGRWRIYRAGRPVGYTRLVAGRWWVYRGTRRVGAVSPSPGGPAAGAALLFLI
jgi:hypothetical protein